MLGLNENPHWVADCVSVLLQRPSPTQCRCVVVSRSDHSHTEQGSVSQSRLSENPEFINPEMRETLSFPFHKGR